MIALGSVEALTVGEGPTLLWFHGGGYVFGSPESHLAMALALAAGGLRVIVPRYRLAPEARWPAMLDDALAAFDAVDGRLAVGGISAGGHLALSVALRRPGRIAGVALISPNTDRSGKSATRGALSDRDLMNEDGTDQELAALAFGELAGRETEASPALADLSSLPPLHLEVGSEEVLLDDSLLLARRAILAGVTTSLCLNPNHFHMVQLWPELAPSARASLERTARWVGARLPS